LFELTVMSCSLDYRRTGSLTTVAIDYESLPK
jgi:hypothetical protein